MTYTRDNLVNALVAERQSQLPVYVYENSEQGHAGRQGLAAPYLGAHAVLDPLNLGFAAAFNAVVEETPPCIDLLLPNPYARTAGKVEPYSGSAPPSGSRSFCAHDRELHDGGDD